MTTRAALALAVVVASAGCGRTDEATHDSAVADSARAESVRDSAPAPRVVPYNPSAPGAMRSGDTPIKAAPAAQTPASSPISRTQSAASQPASRSAAPAARPVPGDSVGDPVAMVRDYYAAIRAHDFLRAFRMWEASGQRNVRSFAQFEAGFDSTESVDVKTGAPGRVEGAAGSRFVTVPVEIDSRLHNGTKQQFTGTYTLRRVVVPGASAAQQRWHLYAANIRQVQ